MGSHGKAGCSEEVSRKCGIATVLNYPKALPFYPAYSYLGQVPEDFPAAYANQFRIPSLPIYPEMTDAMLEYVSTQIEAILALANV
jgi:dTDP-4-amino-4,6-dideoxygalactose transaminase